MDSEFDIEMMYMKDFVISYTKLTKLNSSFSYPNCKNNFLTIVGIPFSVARIFFR